MMADHMSDGPSRWRRTSEADGIVRYQLESWEVYFDFLEIEVFRVSSASSSWIWRGQRRSDWSLSSSLDRLFERLGVIGAGGEVLERLSRQHLDSFKLAARGRRGANPPKLEQPAEWWALGQHYGLATPLLDWSRSPFAAAYFAFEELASDATASRVVYGLDQGLVELKNHEILVAPDVEGRPPIIEFFEPLSDENPRLVNQGGLFTRAPIAVPIERWVANAFEGRTSPVLISVEIPDDDREATLRALNRMNLNHLSLFPDLTGASRYANLKMELGF
jgi:hypothetical protein